MNWKTDYRSIYYLGAPEPPDLDLKREETALLVIDVQNTYRKRPARETLSPEARANYDLWTPFYERLEKLVIPNTRDLLNRFRKHGIECLFARIASHTRHGRERSLSHRKPGWNDLLLPKDDWDSQIVDELLPVGEEIVIHKMTDSALTGSNLRLLLHNLGVRNVVCAGVFTDQCVSSTVRSLADESYNVIVVEDCCAAGSEELHHKELEIINMIYCQVMSSAELKAIMELDR
jgi:nicotinamidase-related amidase